MSDDDVVRSALRGLRRDSLRASRRREPALMVSIGLAEPEEPGEPEEREEDEDGEESDEAANPNDDPRSMNSNYGPTIRKLPATDSARRRK